MAQRVDEEKKGPLAAARERIRARELASANAPQSSESEETRATRLAEYQASAVAELERRRSLQEAWEKFCPEPIKELVDDIAIEMSTKNGDVGIGISYQFEGELQNPLFVTAQLSGQKLVEGKTRIVPAFGKPGTARQKDPDIKYGFNFFLTYKVPQQEVVWQMGNPDGPLIDEVKQQASLIHPHVFTMKVDGRYTGTMVNPVDPDLLAESLTKHLDKQHYEYVIPERVTIMYAANNPRTNLHELTH